ncbi:MAG: LysE family transporter [Ewingella americana]|jgi:threonine/homoserine/homoserine lactone efflux protein|uniref:Threonine efflux protein n=1 Tax=Ewingella americana TaxID=41202 RepID=A0A2N0N1D5_9GAMM|nr:LysE family transporter [Ewingella americana]MDN5681538.1 LysE family transporter [Ewingella sp.]KAA8727690.1 LysE family translocator [Ewingella americana]MCI1679472.1 LysE family transporter [Ewingella americana]MCI1854799.1 LysE family transporter [Ewingella americana]MCI1861918.1 LysE family transporter [Ewingella americana]
MNSYLTVAAIAGTISIGAMSPGPSFVYVAQNAIAKSRKHGLATALGTGTGAAIFAIIALLGLQAFLLAVPLAYWGLKVFGGLYLLYLAYKILKHSKDPMVVETAIAGQSKPRYLKTFRDGLFTQLSNPKTAVVFASIFTALLPAHIPAYYYVVLPLVSFIIDAGWYSFVAYVLSVEKSQKAYIRFKTVIDRVAGTVLMLLGLKLILSSK